MDKKAELIVKQQLQIEEYKEICKRNKEIKRLIKASLVSMGAPLNDNILKFNAAQKRWAWEVLSFVESLDFFVDGDRDD